MTDAPLWATERARELAALWNDPGQEAAIARALAEAAKPGWQPIESAPKDGAHILIYAGGEQFVAFWAVSIEEGDGQWVIARSPGMAFIVRNPTHWAELPAAPEVW